MDLKQNYIAIIPARSGSQGVLHKNIKLLGGYPLIAYSILVAKMIPEINEVIVTTDSKDYADLANRYGAKTPFLRPRSISTDTSTDLDFFKHTIHWFQNNADIIPEKIIHLRPTTPLRDPKLIRKAIKVFNEKKSLTALRSSHLAPESPFKWFIKDKDGLLISLKEGMSADKANDPRQNFPNVFIPDGYVDIIKTETIINNNSLHGAKVKLFETPRTYEVDTEDDFKFIEYLIKKNGSSILDYYRKKFNI